MWDNLLHIVPVIMCLKTAPVAMVHVIDHDIFDWQVVRRPGIEIVANEEAVVVEIPIEGHPAMLPPAGRERVCDRVRVIIEVDPWSLQAVSTCRDPWADGMDAPRLVAPGKKSRCICAADSRR